MSDDFGVWYATRERVLAGLDAGLPPWMYFRVDEAIESGTRMVEGFLHRIFYPLLTTRYWDYPSRTVARAWKIYLEQHELISLDELTSGGVVIDAADYILDPDEGPPYDCIQVDLSSLAAFSSGSTYQRSIGAQGLFGFSDNAASIGTIASAPDADDTTLDVGADGQVGVGSVLKIESERLIVTDRDWLTTAQTLQTPVTASKGDTGLAVTSGAGYAKGERLLLDTEQMVIDGIAGNTLLVRRAQFGTPLAAHTGSTIYAPRRLTVRRGVLGTTAASHALSTAATRWVPPPLVTSLTAAEAVAIFLSENAGYARTVGSGDSEREARGNSLQDLRKQVRAAYGRMGRMLSV